MLLGGSLLYSNMLRFISPNQSIAYEPEIKQKISIVIPFSFLHAASSMGTNKDNHRQNNR